MAILISSPRQPNRPAPITGLTEVKQEPLPQSFWLKLDTMLFEQKNYSGLITEIDKLPLAQKQSNAKLWVYLAIAHRFTGNQAQAKVYLDKFNAWYSQNSDSAQANLLKILLLHRSMKNRQAAGLAQKVTNMVEQFSPAQRKFFYFLAGSALTLILELNPDKEQTMLNQGKEYLEKALQIKLADNPKRAEMIDYCCHIRLAETCRVLGVGNKVEIDQAIKHLQLAMKIRPDSKEACLIWMQLTKEEDIEIPLPEQCPKLVPNGPPNIKIRMEVK